MSTLCRSLKGWNKYVNNHQELVILPLLATGESVGHDYSRPVFPSHKNANSVKDIWVFILKAPKIFEKIP